MQHNIDSNNCSKYVSQASADLVIKFFILSAYNMLVFVWVSALNSVIHKASWGFCVLWMHIEVEMYYLFCTCKG